MRRQPSAIPPVPEETARVAQCAFPNGNRYLLMRDTLLQHRLTATALDLHRAGDWL
jgi:hypothetical protein